MSMMKLTFMLMFILLAGCASAPLTEDEQYEREDREIQRLEQYYRDVADCETTGGIIVIFRHISTGRLRKNTPPRRHERYGCASVSEFQRMMRDMGFR